MKSAFSEMLRLHDDGGSLREVAHDTTITVNNREYVLESGSLVVFPFSCVHKDPDIYENPRHFQIDRFVPHDAKGGDPRRKFEKNGNRIIRPFVPFGGGVNQVQSWLYQ
jgi:cytochrome P450